MTTQVPFECTTLGCTFKARANRDPWKTPIPTCPTCGEVMSPCDYPPASPNHKYADILYTPQSASELILQLPPDTYHWRDARKIKPLAIYQYSERMRLGTWRDYLMANGMWQHPIRFGLDGLLTHGFCRLMACYVSSTNILTATYGPTWVIDELLDGMEMGKVNDSAD